MPEPVKYFWCFDPVVGVHVFGLVNLVAMLFLNSYIYDPRQLVWLVLLNCLVFTPVIVGYVMSLATGTNTRLGRKRFFYSVLVNNFSLIGIIVAIVIMLFMGEYYIDTYAQPEWAPLPRIYKAEPIMYGGLGAVESKPMVVSEGVASAEGDDIGIWYESTPESSDATMAEPAMMPVDANGKVMSEDAMIMPGPYYPERYVPDWVKAVVFIVCLAVILFFEIHTCDVMFKWFSQTPMTA